MNTTHELAYMVDPALWVRQVLGIEPAIWQDEFLRARQGASIIVLTARQVGKTTVAGWAIAHFMIFNPNSMNVIACPSLRQSAEAVRRVKDCLVKAGCKLKTDNVYGIELDNGSRAFALPGTDDSIRGLTVDGWIIASAPMARRRGIVLTSVCPGFVRTDMTAGYRFPMPGLMDADRAARIILRGVAAGRTRVVFPWWMGLAARAAGLVPPRVMAAVMARR